MARKNFNDNIQDSNRIEDQKIQYGENKTLCFASARDQVSLYEQDIDTCLHTLLGVCLCSVLNGTSIAQAGWVGNFDRRSGFVLYCVLRETHAYLWIVEQLSHGTVKPHYL